MRMRPPQGGRCDKKGRRKPAFFMSVAHGAARHPRRMKQVFN
jgi:hypothetical protein